eukprot:7144094-Ditylum_brightwellii.AAC.2
MPKISKTLPIIKWPESFANFLNRKIGVRTIPLAYVIRKEVTAPKPIANRQKDKPHTAKYCSIDGDLVPMASHYHPNYKEDNVKLYYFLKNALCGTSYAIYQAKAKKEIWQKCIDCIDCSIYGK